MKYVLLSADNNPSVYLVPDIVADDLESYCIYFCSKWLREDPNAERYRRDGVFYYTETDFVEYLNTWLFPNEKSVLVETIDWIESEKDVPHKYKGCEWFNF